MLPVGNLHSHTGSAQHPGVQRLRNHPVAQNPQSTSTFIQNQALVSGALSGAETWEDENNQRKNRDGAVVTGQGRAGEAAVPKSLNSGLTELSNTAKNPQ